MLVISAEGKSLGVMPRDEAIRTAQGQGLDLVLVSGKARPVVTKIVDFKKLLYDERKKRQGMKKAQKGGQKQLVIKPNIAPRDLELRIKQAREFLEAGNQVKLTVRFMGREFAHKEVGQNKIQAVLSELNDIVEVEKAPWFEGKRLMILMRPK